MKFSASKKAAGLLCTLLLAGTAANATPLNPSDFDSLGAFFGDITINTSLLTVNGSSGVNYSQGGLGPYLRLPMDLI